MYSLLKLASYSTDTLISTFSHVQSTSHVHTRSHICFHAVCTVVHMYVSQKYSHSRVHTYSYMYTYSHSGTLSFLNFLTCTCAGSSPDEVTLVKIASKVGREKRRRSERERGRERTRRPHVELLG